MAGHATTTTLLCAGAGLPADRPAPLSALLSGRHSWETAVEEVLR